VSSILGGEAVTRLERAIRRRSSACADFEFKLQRTRCRCRGWRRSSSTCFVKATHHSNEADLVGQRARLHRRPESRCDQSLPIATFKLREGINIGAKVSAPARSDYELPRPAITHRPRGFRDFLPRRSPKASTGGATTRSSPGGRSCFPEIDTTRSTRFAACTSSSWTTANTDRSQSPC